MDTVIEVSKQNVVKSKEKERVAWLRETKEIPFVARNIAEAMMAPYVREYRRIPFPGRGKRITFTKRDESATYIWPAEWYEDHPAYVNKSGFRCGGCDRHCAFCINNSEGWHVVIGSWDIHRAKCLGTWKKEYPEEYEKELERVNAREQPVAINSDGESLPPGTIEYWHEFNK